MDTTAPDGNHIIAIASVIVTLVGWVVAKARGKKTEDLSTYFGALVGDLKAQALHQLVLTAESRIEDIRAKLSGYIWEGLERAKVPRNAITEMLVNAAVEAGTTKALDVVRDRWMHKQFNGAKLEIAAASAAMQATIDRTSKDGGLLGQLFDGADVTTAEPDRSSFKPGFPQ